MISYKLLILCYLIISYILGIIYMISWIIGDLAHNKKVSQRNVIVGLLLFPLALPFMFFHLFREELYRNLEDL